MSKRRKNVKGIPSMLMPKFSNKLAGRVDRAIELLEQGALDEAEDILVPLFEDFPNEIMVMMAIVMMFQARKMYEEALALAERLVITHPHDLRARITAVGVKIDVGYAALAYDELKAMSSEKLNSGFREMLENYLFLAEDLLQDAFAEIGPEYDDATKHRIVLLKEQQDFALRLGRYEEAEKCAAALVEIRPENVVIRLSYSDLLFYHAKLEASMEQAQKGLEIDPRNVDCAARIIRVQYLMGIDSPPDLPLASSLSEKISISALEALTFRDDLDTIVALRDKIEEMDEDFKDEALALLGMVLLKKGMVEEAQRLRSGMTSEVEDDDGVQRFGVSAMTVIPGVFLDEDSLENLAIEVKMAPWFTRAINYLLRYGDNPGYFLALTFVAEILSPEFIPALTEVIGEEQRGSKHARDWARNVLTEIRARATT